MKRLLLILAIIIPMIPAAASCSSGGKLTRGKVTGFVTENRHYDGVEVVHLGRLATGALKSFIGFATIGDPEARKVFSMVKGLKGITVFDFDDCEPSVKNKINHRIDRLLRNTEILFEASDSGEKFQIHGIIDEKTDTAKDLILYSSSDCVMICVFGYVSLSRLIEAMADDLD